MESGLWYHAGFILEVFMEVFKRVSEVAQFSAEKMKKNGVFETERLFCDVYCFEAGQAQSVHTHDGSDKVYFVLEGRGLFRIGGEQRELGKDEVALAPSGEPHGVENPGSEPLKLLVVMAPPPGH